VQASEKEESGILAPALRRWVEFDSAELIESEPSDAVYPTTTTTHQQ
jgi:hypothetical protein